MPDTRIDTASTGSLIVESDSVAVAAELTAVIVAVTDGQPRVLTIERGQALPSGPFEPVHRSLQAGLRSWVETQTHHPLDYVEQLYTFADQDRKQGTLGRVVSVSYLGLTREAPVVEGWDAAWQPWYRFFPWEDFRDAKPPVIDKIIAPALRQFAKSAPNSDLAEQRRERARLCFGFEGMTWDEEKVLERYELLYEAGLVQDARLAADSNAVDRWR